MWRLASMLLLFGLPLGVAAAEPLVLAIGVGAPYNRSDGAGLVDLVLGEAFRRIGITAEVVYLPPERALINANQGLEDGDALRVAGLERSYPNLVRVPESITGFDFVAFTQSNDVVADGWDSLEPYVVGIVTGWKILERNVTGTRGLTKVDSGAQLFRLLASGRADVVVFERWQGLVLSQELGIPVRLLEPPLARADMYSYLHQKHRELVPRLAASLAEMKRDGSHQRIVDEVFMSLVADH